MRARISKFYFKGGALNINIFALLESSYLGSFSLLSNLTEGMTRSEKKIFHFLGYLAYSSKYFTLVSNSPFFQGFFSTAKNERIKRYLFLLTATKLNPKKEDKSALERSPGHTARKLF